MNTLYSIAALLLLTISYYHALALTADRNYFINQEANLALGGHLKLSPEEKEANNVFLSLKQSEIDSCFKGQNTFNPSKHFFNRKATIAKSPVFKFIRLMPKGAALHVHDTATIGGEYLVKNLTYRDNLYLCTDDKTPQFKFSKFKPDDSCVWQLVSALRKNSNDVEEFDRILMEMFTLERDNPEILYPDVNKVWEIFMNVFAAVTPLLTFKPVWEDYAYETLRQYREDGINYVELRSTLPPLYDLDGHEYDEIETVKAYKRASDRFKTDYPDSFGLRVIYAPVKIVDLDGAKKYVEILLKLKQTFGDFIAGFDLVGQEDKLQTLYNYLPVLSTIPPDISVFYHSGETNWYGTDSDYNLIDAVLLGSKRIGHGYALLKHPLIAEMVKAKNIVVEVNPLSNQILKLVDDLRNHPASLMIASNYTIIISSDDPGLWGALPLSHDMYEAVMGLCGRFAGLEFFKQLAYNSINYSSMDAAEKTSALRQFEEQWSYFITQFINIQSNKEESCPRDSCPINVINGSPIFQTSGKSIIIAVLLCKFVFQMF